MAKHIYDRDGNKVGEILTEREERDRMIMRGPEGSFVVICVPIVWVIFAAHGWAGTDGLKMIGSVVAVVLGYLLGKLLNKKWDQWGCATMLFILFWILGVVFVSIYFGGGVDDGPIFDWVSAWALPIAAVGGGLGYWFMNKRW